MSKRNIIFILFILFGISDYLLIFNHTFLEQLQGKILARPMEIDQFELIDQNNAAFNNKSLEEFCFVIQTVLMTQPIYKLAEIKM